VLRKEKSKPKGDIVIIFVGTTTIRKLNRQFLKSSHDTDVIAFPYEENSLIPNLGPFGDIFISVPTAQLNARRFKEPLKREVIRLVIHGVLHLLGYSDHTPKEKSLMWKKQESMVQSIIPKMK